MESNDFSRHQLYDFLWPVEALQKSENDSSAEITHGVRWVLKNTPIAW